MKADLGRNSSMHFKEFSSRSTRHIEVIDLELIEEKEK